MAIDTFPSKAPAEVLDYLIGTTALLQQGEALDQPNCSVTVTGGTKTDQSFGAGGVTVWISGGTPGTLIFIDALLATDAGRKFQRRYVIPYREPVSLDRAKLQCRIELDVPEEDELIAGYIIAARALVEDMTGLTLVQRSIVEHFDGFAPRLGTPLEDEHVRHERYALGRRHDRPLWLKSWPIVTVDQVAYTDCDSVAQTLAATRAILGRWPGLLWPPADTSWPTSREAEGVDVTLTAGFAEGSCPPQAVQAMLLLIGHWYLNREAVRAGDRAAAIEIPLAAQALCDMLSLQRV